MTVKLLKWPPTETGVFSADAKRSIELNLTPSAPSFESFLHDVKKAYNTEKSDVVFKIYFYDGFEVMPLLREQDFAFCLSRFQTTYFDYVNYVDINRLYIVESRNVQSSSQLKKTHKQTATASSSEPEIAPGIDRKFALRVAKEFPHVQLLQGNKFKCHCGKTGTLNGKRRMGNIKRHVNTTCRLNSLNNSHVGRTIHDFFSKNGTESGTPVE